MEKAIWRRLKAERGVFFRGDQGKGEGGYRSGSTVVEIADGHW